MARAIKLCLVYRDMWQSSGKYMPRVDQLERVAQPIVEMGCFSRVETNGGGFEQINLLYGENPNQAVRRWTKPFQEAGIQTQMLERGLNALRMNPVPADVRKLMFAVKKKQGTDISRSFDGLNYAPNLKLSFEYAKEAGMIAQGALCITHSKLHTVEYFVNLADKMIELGAEEIAIKDMAGVGRPASIGRMVKGIRERHPEVLIQYHGHSTPGFSLASSLEAARNGADIIDVGMEPLSWGTGHADLLTVHETLRDDGFDVPDINMKAYMEARSLTQEFIDDFLGYYIDPNNRQMNSLLIGPGLPGGMMGSLMADLQSNLASVNRSLEKQGEKALSKDDLLLRLFDEVSYIWPLLGYPPLVTPYSQYVKNAAMMNVMQMAKGKERWSMIDENTWNMLQGKAGKLPGPLGDEIQQLANNQGREFFYGNPQDLYPDELELFAHKMEEKGWDFGLDDEELMQYAMHPPQYEDYKSGKARERFLEDLEKQRAKASGKTQVSTAPSSAVQPAAAPRPETLHIDVNGEQFEVHIRYPENGSMPPPANKPEPAPQKAPAAVSNSAKSILAPLEGKFFLTRDASEKPKRVGDTVKKGDTVGYIEAMKVYNAIAAEHSGKIVEVSVGNGDDVMEDDVLFKID
jgi:pyruvate carboxylase subunit B